MAHRLSFSEKQVDTDQTPLLLLLLPTKEEIQVQLISLPDLYYSRGIWFDFSKKRVELKREPKITFGN